MVHAIRALGLKLWGSGLRFCALDTEAQAAMILVSMVMVLMTVIAMSMIVY